MALTPSEASDHRWHSAGHERPGAPGHPGDAPRRPAGGARSWSAWRSPAAASAAPPSASASSRRSRRSTCSAGSTTCRRSPAAATSAPGSAPTAAAPAQRGDWPWSSTEADWAASIRHLRRYSNYLSPDVGFFSADTWSMFTVWLRNTLLIQWTVVDRGRLRPAAAAPAVRAVRALVRLGDWRWMGVICSSWRSSASPATSSGSAATSRRWLSRPASWRVRACWPERARPGRGVRAPRAGRLRSVPRQPVDPGARADHGRPRWWRAATATLPVGARLYALAPRQPTWTGRR